MDFGKRIIEKIISPPVIAEKDTFQIKIAENDQEIEEAMRLRYEVFNLEQGQGLDTAALDELDRDEFDDYCLHLIVVELEANRIVGTYRIHPGRIANEAIGFYSSREYRIEGLEAIADNTIEIGRSCVHPDFRNGTVVALLWSGIANILKRSEMNFLLGCVSLETTDATIGWAIYEHMIEKGHGTDVLKAEAAEGYELDHPGENEIKNILAENRILVKKSMPPLLKGYLRLGAGVCGPPALDEEFGSIDYLVLFDLSKMPEKYVRHFC
ncbi:GNAT family N-acetyltransferase [Lentisphaerota bacterium ZTH]|nr:GNAT family N-acetyltransferase [Lentisphaerota bacterium]WET06208.1 GNAT family N-acetyltransferase [Lentisphaerota bacterium ZTH]